MRTLGRTQDFLLGQLLKYFCKKWSRQTKIITYLFNTCFIIP